MVLDLVHLSRLRVHPCLRVVEHRVVCPAAFPEFVEHFQVLVGLIVTPVMFDLFAQAHGFGGAVEITGDDVPADATTAQMIERGHASGEQIGRLVGEIRGQTETKIFGHGSHG